MTTDGPYSLRDYILTPSSSDSLEHTNTGVYAHSRRIVDTVFPLHTSQQDDARGTTGVSQHNEQAVESEEEGI